ncbi:DUF1801 domain-containing protein [Niveibacterium sp. SC-1]|uniref:DUF1801 domain-containing protein n=1 Tax=Niveibacterium sp. SC-1 TaxID=3135646 RepID=UPI00311E59ED
MNPKVDDYLARLSGWQASLARELRQRCLAAGLAEDFKWGQPIYSSAEGPVCLLKAHKAHLSFGFWRGQQMRELDTRLEPGGSFQMATLKLTAADRLDAKTVEALVSRGAALNREHGDPLKN